MKRLARVTLIAGALLALSAAPALATHTHVMEIGQDQCVLLAEDSGEERVVLRLPVWNNPNVTVGSTEQTRMHPLHVLVHKGVPGTHNMMEVAGTQAAIDLCGDSIVND